MTREQKQLVMRRLQSGYGVEDIAVRDGIPVGDVRAQVASWRWSGLMKMIFPEVTADGNRRARWIMGGQAELPAPDGGTAA